MGFKEAELLALIPQMRAFAGSLCHDRNHADDLAQDALTRALTSRQSYTAGTNLKAWLFTIVRNQFYSGKRRSWRSTPLDQKMAEETLVAVSNPVAAIELEDVRAATLQLPDLQREALILISVAGLSYLEAASICGCPEGTVKSRVSRGRSRLVELLDKPRRLARRQPPVLGAMAAFYSDADRLCARAAA